MGDGIGITIAMKIEISNGTGLVSKRDQHTRVKIIASPSLLKIVSNRRSLVEVLSWRWRTTSKEWISTLMTNECHHQYLHTLVILYRRTNLKSEIYCQCLRIIYDVAVEHYYQSMKSQSKEWSCILSVPSNCSAEGKSANKLKLLLLDQTFWWRTSQNIKPLFLIEHDTIKTAIITVFPNSCWVFLHTTIYN